MKFLGQVQLSPSSSFLIVIMMLTSSLLIKPSHGLRTCLGICQRNTLSFLHSTTRDSEISSSTPTDASRDYKSMVLCGPSGAGKGAIIGRLLERYPETLSLSVSHTTRQPRQGEIEGVHYHFVSLDKMKADIVNQKNNLQPRKFLEYAEVHTNLYGTSLKAVENIWSKGKLAVLDVDSKGVSQIRESNTVAAKYVFILPPSLEELSRRLRNRGTESEDQMAIRMSNAKVEIDWANKNGDVWDLMLENGNLEACVDKLVDHMRLWFPSYLRTSIPK